MSLQKEISITGNLGSDPKAKYTDSGKFVCNFSVAVQSGWGDNKMTEWFECVAWEKTGEILNEWLRKGSKIQVRGDFKQQIFLSKDTQEPRGKIVITVKEFQFLSSKKEQSETPFDSTSDDRPDEGD